jgi:hypothetical protein
MISAIRATPLPVEPAGAAENPVMLLENPTLIGSPVAGPAAAVVSGLEAAVVAGPGAAVVSGLGAAVVSGLGAAVVVVSSPPQAATAKATNIMSTRSPMDR